MSESKPSDDASLGVKLLSKLGSQSHPRINRGETCFTDPMAAGVEAA